MYSRDKQTSNHKKTYCMVRGKTTQTNYIPDVFAKRFLTQHEPPSQEHTQNQNLLVQIWHDKSLPLVGHKPRHENKIKQFHQQYGWGNCKNSVWARSSDHYNFKNTLQKICTIWWKTNKGNIPQTNFIQGWNLKLNWQKNCFKSNLCLSEKKRCSKPSKKLAPQSINLDDMLFVFGRKKSRGARTKSLS